MVKLKVFKRLFCNLVRFRVQYILYLRPRTNRIVVKIILVPKRTQIDYYNTFFDHLNFVDNLILGVDDIGLLVVFEMSKNHKEIMY